MTPDHIKMGRRKSLGRSLGKSLWLMVTATVIAAVVAGSAPLCPVQAAVDQRELRAREAFAVGRYQEALELFAKLYAEKVHPNYLRNIGRCYQNLGDPDKAITSFRDYLRKAKALPPEERAEVEGYIKEMEDLKAKRQSGTGTDPARGGITPTEAAAGTPTTSSTAPNPNASTVPGAAAPTAPSASAPGADLTAPSESGAPADDAHPVYTRWWFWAAIGGAAALGLGIAAGTGAFTKTVDAPCREGWKC